MIKSNARTENREKISLSLSHLDIKTFYESYLSDAQASMDFY